MKRRSGRDKSKARRPRAGRKAAPASRRTIQQKRVVLLVGTRKGAFIYHGDPTRSRWRLDGPHRLGEIVNHLVLDPPDGETMLMAARAGPPRPNMFYPGAMGRRSEESAHTPAVRKR